MINESFKAAAAAIFVAAQLFVPEKGKVIGTVEDTASLASLATVESGKNYFIHSVASQKIENEGRVANVIALNLVEETSGLASRIYIGTLKRNMEAAQKAGLLVTLGEIKTGIVGKTLSMNHYENLGRDANDRSIIKLSYTIA